MARDTVLVELDEGPAHEPSVEPSDGAPSGRPGPRRWWRWVLAPLVLAVVLGALSGVQALVDARQRAAWDQLAARSDAVLRPLRPTLTSANVADLPVAWWTAAAYGDAVVGLEGGSDGSLDVVSVGLDTWQVRWRQTIEGPAAGLVEGDTRYPSGMCRRVIDEAAVVCLLDDSLAVERQLDGGSGVVTLRPGTVHRLVVLDARTGATRAEVTLPPGDPFGSLAVLPGLAVVAVADESADPAARTVELVGVGLDDGVQRWRTPMGTVVDLTAGASVQVAAVGSGVALAVAQWAVDGTTTGSSVVFVGADGAVQRTVTGLAVPAWFMPTGNGSAVAVSDLTTTVLAVDGDVTLPAGVTTAATDDGSLGPVWFTSDAVYDASGAKLWTMPFGSAAFVSPVVLRGTVYVAAYDRVVALDGATGTERWRSEPIGQAVGQLVTDGSVLGAVAGPDGQPGSLVAFDPRDGRRQWQADVPVALAGLSATLHTMVGWTDRGGYPVLLH